MAAHGTPRFVIVNGLLKTRVVKETSNLQTSLPDDGDVDRRIVYSFFAMATKYFISATKATEDSFVILIGSHGIGFVVV